MNSAQRLVVISLLVGLGVVLPLIFLKFGNGFMVGSEIPILVIKESNARVFATSYGLFTEKGIPGILLGLVVPICLLAAAAFVALGSRNR